MIIEKDYFDAEEVDIANAMNDKSRAPIRKIRLATTDSNKYYAIQTGFTGFQGRSCFQ